MRYQPERALTPCVVIALVILNNGSRNEVSAREGIDTLLFLSIGITRLRRNEVSAREGIDTIMKSKQNSTGPTGRNEVSAREGIDT